MGPLWPTTCFGIKDSSVYKNVISVNFTVTKNCYPEGIRTHALLYARRTLYPAYHENSDFGAKKLDISSNTEPRAPYLLQEHHLDQTQRSWTWIYRHQGFFTIFMMFWGPLSTRYNGVLKLLSSRYNGILKFFPILTKFWSVLSIKCGHF